VRHPTMHGVVRKHVYGMQTVSDDSSVLFPGLGCSNGCFFCATSAKFGGKYIPILPTGESVFKTCLRAEERLGVREFAVIDENFLKTPDRARDLLRLMEENGRNYHFWIFASAEAVTAVGVDFLVRLGVCALWMGLETSKEMFGKLGGIDVRSLISELQAKGISVISSSILFMEHHDPRSLDEDIDWAIGMGTDLHQFMQLTPLPGTPLYKRYLEEGKLIPGFPYQRLSGQIALSFLHNNFTTDEAGKITRMAFRRKYEADGPGIVNMARTALAGYERALADSVERDRIGLGWNWSTMRYDRAGRSEPDTFMQGRIRFLRQRAREFRPILPASLLFSPNAAARARSAALMRRYRTVFGKPSFQDVAGYIVLIATGALEWLRHLAARILGRDELVRQPRCRRIEYPAGPKGMQ